MHSDIMKLLSIGVGEKFLQEAKIALAKTCDLVKGLLYLRECYNEEFA